MGCGPVLGRQTACMNVTANLRSEPLAFHTPSVACGDSFPALRRRGSSCLAQRRTNALDDDRQSADDELVWKSKHTKSRASKPRVPLGVLDLRIRRLVRAAVRFDDDFSRKTHEVREIGSDRGLPAKAGVRRFDDSAPRAKAWSPPSSCSDAARERICVRTDGNAAARPSCLPITSRSLPHGAGAGAIGRREMPVGRRGTAPDGVRPTASTQVGLHDRRRVAFIDASLLSTPHPALRATFPSTAGEGTAPAIVHRNKL